MREAWSEEEVTRDLGGSAGRRMADGEWVPLRALESVEQPVVIHDGQVVRWGNGAALHLVGAPVAGEWPDGLVEVAACPAGEGRVVCVLGAPPRVGGTDLERLNRIEVMALAAAGLAHDMGSPLTAVSAQLAELARSLLEFEAAAPKTAGATLERCRGAVLVIDEATGYLARMAREFGRFSYAAEAAGPARVRRAVTLALRMTRPLVADRATVELAGAGDVSAAVPEETLTRVLVNLIVNAAAAFPPRRAHENRIVITATGSRAGVIVDVEDNAGGVPANLIPRLFEPFATARAGRPNLGIGLAVARALLRRAGGDLELVETGREGSRFRCILPAVNRDSRR